MNELKIFENEEFGKIRAIEKDGEPWFVGKDVANILGYSNSRKALSDHVDSDDKIDGVPIRDSIGREQKPVFINESGLYSLILSSHLPTAKKFKRWVTSEVLPSIKKYGVYASDKAIDYMLDNPDYMISVITKLKEERDRRIKAERTNAVLMHVNKTYTTTEIAKELNFKSAQELNMKLCDKGVQFKSNGTWVLYSDYSNKGYEEIKQEVLDNGKVVYHRKFTQLGRKFILDLFQDEAC